MEKGGNCGAGGKAKMEAGGCGWKGKMEAGGCGWKSKRKAGGHGWKGQKGSGQRWMENGSEWESKMVKMGEAGGRAKGERGKGIMGHIIQGMDIA